MAPVRFETKDTVYAVTQAIMTVLRYSPNPAFVTTVLAHLKVSTLEEAELRLGQHLWSILHKHLHIELPLDVAEALASLPLLPPASPSRTCTTRHRCNPGEGATSSDLSPAAEDCGQILSSLPACGQLYGPSMASPQEYPEFQGEDFRRLQLNIAWPEKKVSESASPGRALRIEGNAAENLIQTDIERLCDQVLSSSAAREDPTSNHSVGCSPPMASAKEDETTVTSSSPHPSSDGHREIFEEPQKKNTVVQEPVPQGLGAEDDNSPIAVKNRIVQGLQLLSETVEERQDLGSHSKRIETALSNLSATLALDTQTQPCSLTPSLSQSSADMHATEATDYDQEKDATSGTIKNKILGALSLLSGSLSLTTSLQAQTPPSSLSQGSPYRLPLSGLPQECRGEHEPFLLQELLEQFAESESLVPSDDSRGVLNIQSVAPQVDQRPLNDAAGMDLTARPLLRVRHDLWSREEASVTSVTRHVSALHSFSPGKADKPQANTRPSTSGNGNEGGLSIVSDASLQSHITDNILFYGVRDGYGSNSLKPPEGEGIGGEDHRPALMETSTRDILADSDDEYIEFVSSAEDTERAEVSDLEVAEPNPALEAVPRSLPLGKRRSVQRKTQLPSQSTPPPPSSHSSPLATPRKKRNRSLEHPLCRPTTKRIRVLGPKTAAQPCHEPATAFPRREAPPANQVGRWLPLHHQHGTQTEITQPSPPPPQTPPRLKPQMPPSSRPLHASPPPSPALLLPSLLSQPVPPQPVVSDAIGSQENLLDTSRHELDTFYSNRHHHQPNHEQQQQQQQKQQPINSANEVNTSPVLNVSEPSKARDGKAVRQDEKDSDFGVVEDRGDDREEGSPSLLEGLTYESVLATLTESFPWAKAGNSSDQEYPEGRPSSVLPGQQDTPLEELEEGNMPLNFKGEMGSSSTPRENTQVANMRASETLAPQDSVEDTAGATRNLTRASLISEKSERAADSPANAPGALPSTHQPHGPSWPGSEPEKARQLGENLVRVTRLGNVINETSAPEATAGQEASLSPANLPARLSACLAPHSPPTTQPLQGFSAQCTHHPSTLHTNPQPHSSSSRHPVSPSTSHLPASSTSHPFSSSSSHPSNPSISHNGSTLLHSRGPSSLHSLSSSSRHASSHPRSPTSPHPYTPSSSRPVSSCIPHVLGPCTPQSSCSSSPQLMGAPTPPPQTCNPATPQPCGCSSSTTFSPCSLVQLSDPNTPQPRSSPSTSSTPRPASLSTVTLDSSVEVVEEESDQEMSVGAGVGRGIGMLRLPAALGQESPHVSVVDLTSPTRDPSFDSHFD